MDFTYLASIEFYTDNQKRIREYYQTKDNFIRESSFDDENGWFTSGNGIITKDAKEKSPITVTRWNGSSGTEVMALDSKFPCIPLLSTSTVGWLAKPDLPHFSRNSDLFAGSSTFGDFPCVLHQK